MAATTTPARKKKETVRRRLARKGAILAAGLATATALIGTFDVTFAEPANAFCSIYDPCSGGNRDPGLPPDPWPGPAPAPPPPPGTGGGDGGGGGGDPGTSNQVSSTISTAQTALEQKPDCSQMITGPSRFTAQAILYTLSHNDHILDKTYQNSPNQGPNDKIYATTDIGQGSDGYMTIWQPFTNPEAGGPVTALLEYQGQPLHLQPNWQDIFRAAVILHELSHATGAIGDDSGWSAGRKADSFNAIIDKCL